MHYVQKYLEKLPISKSNMKTNEGKKCSIFLYCNYYSFYSQKVCKFLCIEKQTNML